MLGFSVAWNSVRRCREVCAATGLVAVMTLLAGTSLAQQEQTQPTQQPRVQYQAPELPTASQPGKTMMYRHPKLGYFLAIPPGAIVEHREKINGIALKSRKGYMITLQTGQAKIGTPLPEMMTHLEHRYLGTGKPWTRKLGEQPTRLAGLEGFEAIYEGAGSMVRVVVARGPVLDYAFIFIAPPQEFKKLVGDFNWVLRSFRPALAPKGESSATGGDGLVEMMQGKVQTLPDQGIGYTLNYPQSWIVEQGEGPVIILSGRQGTPAYYATVNIQNIRPAVGDGDLTKATQHVVASLKNQLRAADAGVRFPGQGGYVYSRQGQTLHGLQFTVEYERGGKAFRQWNVVLPRPDNGLVHVWSYAAPQEIYDRYGVIAGKILESWTINLSR